ncbi:MAG TPA: ATP-binding protein [Acidobacteriota bacterium]|nr:ATP-binding protein [Acidobacteriota bacterium]
MAGAKTRSNVSYWWLLSPLLVIVVYLLDMWAPAHLAIPICYLATLVLVVAMPSKREKILLATVCTILLLIDLLFSSRNPTASAEALILNYGLAIIMVWSVTILGLRHRRVQEGMRDNQRIANERLALIDTIYASAPVGLCFVDRNLHYVSINNALAEMNGHTPEYYLGKTVREAIPDMANEIESHYRRVIESGQPVVDVEVSGVTPARANERRYWLCSYFPVQNDSGALLGVNVAVREITGRKKAEANTLFLLDLGECIRFAVNADELLWAVAVALGEHLQASRCAFIEIDSQSERFVVQRDYHPHMPSLVGNASLSALSPVFIDVTHASQFTVISDVEHDERMAQFASSLRQMGVAAFVASPLLRDGKLVAALIVGKSDPYLWNEREIALINLVAERTWLAAEKLKLDAALRESDAALRDADRRKDEFLATLAHELRNPLSLMRNVVTLQQTASAPDGDPRWGRDIIERQVNYLTRLTDDLFDVSRITREKLELQRETVNLPEIINAAVESCRPLIDQRQHQLTVTMPQDAIYVDGDRVRLTQVFMNLLNNAAKYTPDPGQIWLNVEPTGDTVEVRVRDTGMGIAPENLPHLFELFYQVDRSFTRAESGLGLGLTLVHRLVELHGGKVEARSAGVNSGSEFIVRLPVVAQPAKIPEHHALDQHTNVMAPRPRRILVADDFPQSAETLARLLRHDGSEVRIAQDGVEAYETAAEFRPDVVVLDIAMPRLNGYEAARKIRAQIWGKQMVLIALTGWGQQQDRRRTQEAGFDAHLTKPVNYEAIMELLKKLPTTTLAVASQTLSQ